MQPLHLCMTRHLFRMAQVGPRTPCCLLHNQLAAVAVSLMVAPPGHYNLPHYQVQFVLWQL
jgi:hypothetical protein